MRNRACTEVAVVLRVDLPLIGRVNLLWFAMEDVNDAFVQFFVRTEPSVPMMASRAWSHLRDAAP